MYLWMSRTSLSACSTFFAFLSNKVDAYPSAFEVLSSCLATNQLITNELGVDIHDRRLTDKDRELDAILQRLQRACNELGASLAFITKVY